MNRYRVRIVNSTFVGVFDLKERKFVRTQDGQPFATSDVTEAEFLAEELNYREF